MGWFADIVIGAESRRFEVPGALDLFESIDCDFSK
jgi:hypothetical protein